MSYKAEGTEGSSSRGGRWESARLSLGPVAPPLLEDVLGVIKNARVIVPVGRRAWRTASHHGLLCGSLLMKRWPPSSFLISQSEAGGSCSPESKPPPINI